MLTSLLGRVSGGEDLTMEQMSDVVDVIMQGKATDSEIAQLLTALRAKGEAVEEIAGAAAAMRKHMTRIHSAREVLVDTCGTGGSGSGTFNISTAAAIVTAASGVAVAKHGNRRVTSKTGSADVLAELGVNVEASVATVERCLGELGICFCFAPLMHGAMKHVAHVRRQLGVPTIFNLLGPLCNPAGAPFQVLGVGRADIRQPLAEALAKLGTRHSVVVHGEDGMGEVTLAGRTDVTEVQDEQTSEMTWEPQDFDSDSAPLDTLMAETPTESAAIIRQILEGQPSPAREIVVLNAAAAIWVSDSAADLADAASRARQAIDGGSARDLLARLVEVSSS